MTDFKWDDKLDVGIQKFNEQHKKLFKCLENLYTAMENKRDKLALAQVINDLLSYAKEHLTEEETCFLLHNYPGYDEQRKQHKIFIEKMTQFADDFNNDKQFIHFEIAVFIKNWIVNHILVLDKKYTEFLNSKGVY